MPRFVSTGIILTYKQETASIPANVIVVEGTADGQVALPGAANAGKIVGITKYAGSATANDSIEVQVTGIADLIVDAAGVDIERGHPIAIEGTDGHGYYTALANARHYVGQALEGSTADGDIISVLLGRFSTPAS